MQDNKHLSNLAAEPKQSGHVRKKSDFKFQSNQQAKPLSKQQMTGKNSRAGSLTIDTELDGDEPQKSDKKESESKQEAASANWDMFTKICRLGEGAFGTVYKVKCLKSSILTGGTEGTRVVLTDPTMKMKRKLQKHSLGVNMQSNVDAQNRVRSLVQDQYYVIKVIDTSKLPQEAALEALQEIELLAELDSHFIVGYLDAFIEDATINIIMEFCHHGDLCTFLKKQNGKKMVDNFIWKVFIHMCLGLHYLHSRNIIHRDIKSLNVFLTKDNSAKIGDLGAARKLDSDGNELQQISENEVFGEEKPPQKVGTPFYLAPELWQDKPCSKKSDIWALGVILYELCTLKFPYEASEMEELEYKVLKEKYGTIPNNVTKDLKLIIKQCLQRKAENRPSIDNIIFDDTFQQKCKLNRITLPLELNKSKLIQKIQKQLPQSEATVDKNATKEELILNLQAVNQKSSASKNKDNASNTSHVHSRAGSSASTNSPFKQANYQSSSNLGNSYKSKDKAAVSGNLKDQRRGSKMLPTIPNRPSGGRLTARNSNEGPQKLAPDGPHTTSRKIQQKQFGPAQTRTSMLRAQKRQEDKQPKRMFGEVSSNQPMHTDPGRVGTEPTENDKELMSFEIPDDASENKLKNRTAVDKSKLEKGKPFVSQTPKHMGSFKSSRDLKYKKPVYNVPSTRNLHKRNQASETEVTLGQKPRVQMFNKATKLKQPQSVSSSKEPFGFRKQTTYTDKRKIYNPTDKIKQSPSQPILGMAPQSKYRSQRNSNASNSNSQSYLNRRQSGIGSGMFSKPKDSSQKQPVKAVPLTARTEKTSKLPLREPNDRLSDAKNSTAKMQETRKDIIVEDFVGYMNDDIDAVDQDTGDVIDPHQRPRTSTHRRNETLQAAYDKLDIQMETAPIDDDLDLLGADTLLDTPKQPNPLENTGRLDLDALQRQDDNFKQAVDHLKPPLQEGDPELLRASGVSCPPLIIEETEDDDFVIKRVSRKEDANKFQSMIQQPLDRLSQVMSQSKPEEEELFDHLLTDDVDDLMQEAFKDDLLV